MFEIRSIMYKVAFKRYIGTSLRGGRVRGASSIDEVFCNKCIICSLTKASQP